MAKQLQKMLGGGGSGGGLPRGAGLGMKLLGAAAVIGIGINQSMYTGELSVTYVHLVQWTIFFNPILSGWRSSCCTVQSSHWSSAEGLRRGNSLQVKTSAMYLHYTHQHTTHRVPWFHYPIIYDIRARPKLLTSPTGSKDLQMVNIGLRVLYRPNQHSLPAMYRLLGVDYDERVLPSICNEVSIQMYT